MKLSIETEEKRLVDVTQQPPKFSSSFYTDNQREQKLIKEAFSSNNYTNLRQLPNFKRNELLEHSKQKVFDVADLKRPMVKLTGTGGYFSNFEYYPTQYEFGRYLDNIHHIQHVCKQAQISDKPFIPAQIPKKLKYEDQFQEKEYTYPFHLPMDTFDTKKESETRQQIISECQRLAGSFLPSGKQPIRHTDMNDIIQSFKGIFLKDWPMEKVVIYATQNERIFISFIDCHIPKEILVYMNCLLNDERIAHYQLTRIINEWGTIQQENQFTFTIKPLWAK